MPAPCTGATTPGRYAQLRCERPLLGLRVREAAEARPVAPPRGTTARHRVPAAIPSGAVVNMRTHVRYANKRDGTSRRPSCTWPFARPRLLPSAGFRRSRRRLQSVGLRTGARYGVLGSTPAPASSSCTRMSASGHRRARFEHVTRLWRNWHTRWLQEPLGASPWRFESSQPHFHVARRGDHLEARAHRWRSLLRRSCVAPLRSLPCSSSAARVWGARRIAARTGLPVSTVRDWLAGRLPGHARSAASNCPVCGHPQHAFDELPAEYCYLLGLYLGDGCISAGPRDVYRLRIHLDLAYPGIVDECETAIQAVAPRNRVHRLLRTSNYTKGPEPSLVEVSAYSRAWPCLFPQHGPCRKHEREIKLVAWQRALVQRHARSLLRGPDPL